MRLICRAVLLIGILLFAAPLSAQIAGANFRHYTSEDGLPGDQINCVLQDSQGYVWLGTEDGLSRFDGLDFKNYGLARAGKQGLSALMVNALAEDAGGVLWIGTIEGLNRFEPTTGLFTHYLPPSPSTSVKALNVRSLMVDKKGIIWIGTTARGLFAFDPSTSVFTNFLLHSFAPSFRENWDNNTVDAIIEDLEDSNLLWLACRNGLHLFNKKEKTFTAFPYLDDNGEKVWIYNHLKSMQHLRPGELWVGRWDGGIGRFDIATKKWSNDLFGGDKKRKKGTILSMAPRNAASLWLADRNHGFGYYDFVADRFHYYTYQSDNRFSIAENTAKCVYVTKDGLVWIGLGNSKGLAVLDPALNQFPYIDLPLMHANNPTEAGISDFHYDPASKQLYMATFNGAGIAVMDSNYTFMKMLGLPEWKQKPVWVYDMLFDSKGNLWADGDWKLQRRQLPNGRFEEVDIYDQLDIQPIRITRLYESSKRSLYLGTRGAGLIRMDGDQIRQYYKRDEAVGINPHAEITHILEDKSGMLWLASDGLYQLNPETGEVLHFNKESDGIRLPENAVTALCFDEEGKLWVGLLTSGILIVDVEQLEVVKTYGMENGLPSNNMLEIISEAGGRMWMTCRRGLVTFDSDKEQFLHFGLRDGLKKHYINDLSLQPDGRLYLSMDHGFHYVHPDSLLSSSSSVRPIISSIKLYDQELRPERYQTRIELPHDSSYLSIELAAMSYSIPEKNSYRYQLEGLENHWTLSTGKNRKVEYRALAPGEYTFRLKVADHLGNWNDEELRLPIYIHPPWWKTIWFQLLNLLIVAALLSGVYRWRIRRLKQKAKIEQRMAELENKALRAQMNPHFIFNSLNSIKSLIQSQQDEEAITYLTKFSKLIRQVLQHSEQPQISLSQELEMARLYLNMESLRFEDKFNWSIECSEEVDTSYVRVPPMLLQPYLENSIWHGLLHLESPGQLLLHILLENDAIKVIIDDNGIGRKKAAQLQSKNATTHKSMGLQLTANRLALSKQLNGQIIEVNIIDKYTTEGVAAGTQVELLLKRPLS